MGRRMAAGPSLAAFVASMLFVSGCASVSTGRTTAAVPAVTTVARTSAPPAATPPAATTSAPTTTRGREAAPLPTAGPSPLPPADLDVWPAHRGGVACDAADARPSAAPIRYVAPDGSDAASGDTPATASRTIARALCDLGPGQEVRILPGVYRESVLLTGFRFAEPVTIRGVVDEDGSLPVLTGGGELTMGIALVESSGFRLEGLEFREYTDEGLLVALSDDVQVRNGRFVGNGFASIEPDFDGEGFGLAAVDVTRLVVEGNEVAGNGPSPERRARYLLGTGIDLFGVEDAAIRGNRVHDTIGGGILVEDSVRVLVAGNVVTDNELDANGDYWDGGIWVDGGHDVTLRENTIARNHGPGIELSDEDRQSPTGYLVTGNVVRDNLWGVFIWNFGTCPWPSPDVVAVEANVFSGNVRGDVWCRTEG